MIGLSMLLPFGIRQGKITQAQPIAPLTHGPGLCSNGRF